MISLSPAAGPLHVLCLGAHPDDVEIGCGGTLLELSTRPETSVSTVVLTGTVERRQEAQQANPRFFPGARVTVLDFPDGRLPQQWGEVKAALEDLSGHIRPDLVLAPRVDDAHQDHRLLGQLASTVWRDALTLHYEIPKWDADLTPPTHYVAVSDTNAARKVELLSLSFPSQVHRDWWDDELFRGLMRLRGIETRARYAEGFYASKVRLSVDVEGIRSMTLPEVTLPGLTPSHTPSTVPLRSFARSNEAQARLHEIVPGGAHTYARGSDQYPEDMAPVIVRGEGARVEDLDGNSYVEYGMGLRSVTLGHGYQPVVAAAAGAAAGGMNFSRPSIWELRAAEIFLAQVPGAEMVKFAKNGSDATTAAVKLSRAVTGRPLVGLCGTQPFFSTDDWFIHTTTMRAGIPVEHQTSTVQFRYNDLDSVRDLLERHPGQIACLILEAATALAEPEAGFLEGLRRLADQDGFLLIFDEMITGMRWSIGGAQAVYNVTPDLSTWGKALGNGYPISALAGRREFMEHGGLNTDASRVFLLSTTHGPEVVSLAAYLAVVQAYQEHNVVQTMERQGTKLADAVNEVCREHGLQDHVAVRGRPSCLIYTTHDHDGEPSQAYRTLFMQELLNRGVLGQSFVISAAHTDDDIAQTVDAVRAALDVYGQALVERTTEGRLRGRPVAPALREFAAPRRLAR